jgi:hypothetical protein
MAAELPQPQQQHQDVVRLDIRDLPHLTVKSRQLMVILEWVFCIL